MTFFDFQNIALGEQAWSLDRLLQGHTMIDDIDNRLQR